MTPQATASTAGVSTASRAAPAGAGQADPEGLYLSDGPTIDVYAPPTERWPVAWPYLISILTYHALSLLAFVPWFFSWTGVVLCVAGFYVFGTLGINLCFHRLLTHRGFECPKWLERGFAILGVCCLQDTPARWVAIHRMHHQHSDEPLDPHSPIVRFFWAHMGWLMVQNPMINNVSTYDRYARDVLKDPFYFWFERNLRWFTVNVAQMAVFYAVGMLVGLALWRDLAVAAQYATSIVLWGVIVRTVAVWHITWSVNSLSHVLGYQNYDTGENSRNNWFVALVSNGEGWHNNHHADQRSARHGHRWWEFDVTWLTIRVLERVGLVRSVIVPKQQTPRAAAH